MAGYLIHGIASFISNMGSGPSIADIGSALPAQNTLHAAEVAATQFANAAAHPMSQTGLPIIQSLSLHSRIVEHMSQISTEVVQQGTEENVNSFLQQLSWFNFWTGYNSRTTTLKPANLRALQENDLEMELKRNEALITNFKAARDKLLGSKERISKEQLNNANQQISVIVRDAELRNQEILAEFQKRRVAAAKQGEKVINTEWKDKAKFSAACEAIKKQNEKARQRVSETLDRERKSEQAHIAPMLTGYKVATSHEKTLKASSGERNPEEAQQMATSITKAYPDVAVNFTAAEEFTLTSNNTKNLCDSARECFSSEKAEMFDLIAPNLTAALEVLREAQAHEPMIRIATVRYPGVDILGTAEVQQFMKQHGIQPLVVSEEHRLSKPKDT